MVIAPHVHSCQLVDAKSECILAFSGISLIIYKMDGSVTSDREWCEGFSMKIHNISVILHICLAITYL